MNTRLIFYDQISGFFSVENINWRKSIWVSQNRPLQLNACFQLVVLLPGEYI